MAARLQTDMAYFISLALTSALLEETLLALEDGRIDMVSDSGTSLVSICPEVLLIVTLVSEERESSKDTCFFRLDKLWLELLKLLRLLPGDKDKVNC